MKIYRLITVVILVEYSSRTALNESIFVPKKKKCQLWGNKFRTQLISLKITFLISKQEIMKNTKTNRSSALKIASLFMLLLVMLSCSDNADDISNEPSTDFNYDAGNSVNRNFNGLILDTSGNPVANALVQIGSSSAQTNASGSFSITNAPVKERFAHVKVTKAGFINGSRVLVPTSGDNRINIMLIPNTPTATIVSGANSEVSLPNGTKVKFDGSFKDASGNPYSGTVQVGLYHLKPSDTYLGQLMPGSLLASNATGEARILETFGMLHVELTGSGGQKLNLANGHTAEISLDIDATQLSSSPTTIPLWSFDEGNGIWKEEGSATRVGNKYIGNVSHFSWWNCDAPFPQCNLTVTVHNAANQPISNLVVSILRPGQTSGAPGMTNGNGQVTGIVPANETLTIQILDFCGNVAYTGSAGPFTAGSSNTNPIITLSPSTITTVTITGTLQTCSNTNVTNGSVQLSNTSSPNYFSDIIQNVTNGSFSFVTNICGASQQFELLGIDTTNLQITNPILFTATAPVTNIGVIATCTSTNEFITFQVDNNPINTIITGIGCNYETTQGNFLTISSQQNTSFFYLGGSNIPGIGTYTGANFNMEFTTTPGAISGLSASNTMQFVISQLGPVGGYVDVTFNGTYTDSSGTHTLSGTAHVLRDN